MKVTKRTKASFFERRALKAMLDAFRMLGPIESLDWMAEYFEDYQATLANHEHPAPWCDALVAEVRVLVSKYKLENERVEQAAARQRA